MTIRFGLTIAILTTGPFFLLTTIGATAAFLVHLSREFHTTIPIVGQLLTVSAVAWALFGALFGPLSDRTGRKFMVLVGLLITGFGIIGYSISWNFSVLIGFGTIIGMGGAMAGPHSITSVGDYFPEKGRGKIISVVSAGAPLSSLIGIPLGTFLADLLGWRMSFRCLGALMIFTAILGYFILPPSQPQDSKNDKTIIAIFREAFLQRHLLRFITANTFMESAFHTVYTYLIAFLILNYTLSLGQTAPLIATMAIGQLIGNFVGGLLADRYNRIKICAVSQIFVGLTGLALMVITQNLWLSVALGSLYKAFYSNTRPSFFSLMVSSDSARGASMGLVALSNHIGRALGAMVGGLTLGLFGYYSLGLLCLVFSAGAASIFQRISSFKKTSPSDAAAGSLS